MKMNGHKYIRREGTKGNYRYFYPNTSLSPDKDYDRRKSIDDSVNKEITNMSVEEMNYALDYQKRNKVPFMYQTGDKDADKFFTDEYAKRLEKQKKERQQMIFDSNQRAKEKKRKRLKDLAYNVKKKYEALHVQAKGR